METEERLALMGQIVTVHSEYVRKYSGLRYRDGTRRHWEPEEVDMPRAGWVIGFRTLQNGTYHAWREPPYLGSTESVPCVLVAYWPTYNPVKVPLDGFELGGQPKNTTGLWWETSRYAEQHRKWLREDAESWPRDEKGRWV